LISPIANTRPLLITFLTTPTIDIPVKRQIALALAAIAVQDMTWTNPVKDICETCDPSISIMWLGVMPEMVRKNNQIPVKVIRDFVPSSFPLM